MNFVEITSMKYSSIETIILQAAQADEFAARACGSGPMCLNGATVIPTRSTTFRAQSGGAAPLRAWPQGNENLRLTGLAGSLGRDRRTGGKRLIRSSDRGPGDKSLFGEVIEFAIFCPIDEGRPLSARIGQYRPARILGMPDENQPRLRAYFHAVR